MPPRAAGFFGHAFWRFCMVGAVGFITDALLLAGLIGLGWHPIAARLISVAVAMSVTWWWNRRFTFRVTTLPTWKEWTTYQLVNGSGALHNYGIYSLLVLLGCPWFGALCAGSGVALTYNYLANKRITFKEKS